MRRGRRQRLRARLALMYFAAFLGSGAVLLVITVVLFRQKTAVHSSAAAVPVGGILPASVAPPGFGSASQQHSTDVHQLLVVSGLALAITALASIVIGWVVAGRLLRPLQAMTATARHISATNLRERIDLAGPDDELRELAVTLDELFGRLEASFESQRHFVANASHELRTPLTVERTLLQVALADPDATAAELRAACGKVLALGRDQERLIEALLALASGERGVERWEPFDLGEVTGQAVAARRDDADRSGLHIDAVLSPAPAVGDPTLVTSLVGNLVDNALRYNLPAGRVEVSTSIMAGRATLRVGNTGPRVPGGDVERLFRPFQRLGSERVRHGDGHGLGLAIVAAVAEAHGATLSARPRPGGGLDIDVGFPASDAGPTDRGVHRRRTSPVSERARST